jgi:hypothetical protein
MRGPGFSLTRFFTSCLPTHRKQSNFDEKTGFEVRTAYEVRRTTGHILPENQSHSFDDAEVALRCGSKSLQSGLIRGAIVSSYSLFKTLFERNNHVQMIIMADRPTIISAQMKET